MLQELLSMSAWFMTMDWQTMTLASQANIISLSLFEMTEGIPHSRYPYQTYSQWHNVYGVLIAVVLLLLYNDMYGDEDDDDDGFQG
jgi:hypothetical protein